MVVRKRKSALALALAATLSLSGCEAYHSAYWSFPLNSIQVVENAAENDWSYRKAVGFEMLFQLFPYYLLLSVCDTAMLPVTIVHDLVVAFSDAPGQTFAEQVETEKRHHRDRYRPPFAPPTQSQVPSPAPESGFER